MPSKAPMKKPKTPKPHPMAFVGEAPCPICGCEWFRPTLTFPSDEEDDRADALIQGVACANLWCVMIAKLRNQIATLKRERLMLARLAADGPAFFNPVDAWEAKALRDLVLTEVSDAR